MSWICSHCDQVTTFLVEDMCQACFDKGLKGLQDAPEYWFQRIHRQLDVIQADIAKINEQLRMQLKG